MDYLEKARRVIALEAAELQRLSARIDRSFGSAVEAIRRSVENRGKVVVVGVGKSGNIGEKIAATLTSTGSPAVVLNSLNALHGDLGVVADGDVILALSSSGETDELINILPALQRFDVQIIAMTGNAKSFLAQNCHIHLDVNVEQEACPLNLAPTSSTTVMLVLGDALAMVLLESRGFNKEDFAKFHPGGQLGRTLLFKVHQIMRGPEQMALVAPTLLVRDVLHAMAKARAGAAEVVDEHGRLLGIFTHGDFGRHFQKHGDLLERAVGDFMTRNPITIRGDRLAAEVLHILETHRIDDLVVVDESGKPVGVVDSQDLARFKLI
jgi:arabinose-5-phosphate isomerase